MRKHILAIALVASVVGLAFSSSAEDTSSAVARRDGRVTIVYDDAGIKPESRDVVNS